tara:strand:- start:196 stop:588 length:393 start_codon:yes stop_codon:yes gene_type:complete
MGMYTELIFGADLKKDTHENVIEALKYMIGDTEEKPKDFPLPDGRCEWLFRGSSCYFGVNSPVSKMWKDDIGENWVLSTRSNIKNYEGEIEAFLDWIKPYIDGGSGYRDMYAIVTYEEAEAPNIYYLHDD